MKMPVCTLWQCLWGSSIGKVIVPLFYEIFIEQYAWSGAFILMAGIAVQNVPFGLNVHYSRRYFKSNRTLEKTKVSTLCDFSVLNDWLIWIVYLNFHLFSLTGHFEAWFLVDLAISRGFTRELGSILVTVLGFANVIGRILGRVLRFKCTYMPSLNHWIYLCPMLTFGHVLIVNISEYWGLFACCILYGIPIGVISSQPAPIILEITSLEKYPQAMALANLKFGLSNVISGQLGGLIRDTLGDYDLAFYIAAVVSVYISLTSGVAAIVIKRRHESYRNRTNFSNSKVLYENDFYISYGL